MKAFIFCALDQPSGVRPLLHAHASARGSHGQQEVADAHAREARLAEPRGDARTGANTTALPAASWGRLEAGSMEESLRGFAAANSGRRTLTTDMVVSCLPVEPPALRWVVVEPSWSAPRLSGSAAWLSSRAAP